jgi:TatD DNase family protein
MLDYHTHNPHVAPGSAIVNLPLETVRQPETFQPQAGALYSVGVHPWWTDQDVEALLVGVEQLAQYPQVVVIGECGLDSLRGAQIEKQMEVLKYQLHLAERVQKPVTLHIVRTFHQILSLRREISPKQRWVIHGFRGKPQLAQQLLDAGFCLSYGSRYNVDSYRLTPDDRKYHETDENATF